MRCWRNGISWRTSWIKANNLSATEQPSNLVAYPYIDLHIEPAGWRDLGGVLKLEKSCFSSDDRWPFLDVAAVLTLPNIFRLKVELGGELIAFIAAELHAAQKLAWITTIGVAAEHRQHGIASRLLAACEAAVDYPAVRLSVRRSNLSAIRLYERHGYQQINVWPKYYIGGEDALIFEKSLEN